MSLAAGACEAVFLGKSFQGCVPCHSLILPPASGCRLYHPASLQKRPDVPAPLLRTLVRIATDRTSPRPRSGSTVRKHRASSEQLKRCFRQRVQNRLMLNLKCGLIAASPAELPRRLPVIAAHQPQSLANHLKIRAAVACAVVRRPSPAPVIRAVTQQHVALGRQHLGRGNRRSSSPESPQLLCTHRGCSQYHARGHLGHVMGVVRIYCRCRRAQAGWS